MKKGKYKLSRKIIAAIAIAGTITGANVGSEIYFVCKQIGYYSEIQGIDDKLAQTEDSVVDLFEDLKIKGVTITSTGNSLGDGFSLKDKNKPLPARMETFSDKLEDKNIDCKSYTFARFQDNCDEHTLNMLLNNIRQSQINLLNQQDYKDKSSMANRKYMSDEDLNKYYPLVVGDDKTLNEIVLNKDYNNLNIVVYNGATGSMLDNITRGSEDLGNSFNRDLTSIEAFCEYIFLKNPRTQIYLCGIPDYLNIGLTEIFNVKLKDIASSYPNITYVEPAPCKMIYITSDGLSPDIHYDENEYDLLINNILTDVHNQCLGNMICTDLFFELQTLSQTNFQNYASKGDEELVRLSIEAIIQKYNNTNIDNELITNGINKFINIFKKRYGYDFYYVSSKDSVVSMLQDKVNELKANKLVKQ